MHRDIIVLGEMRTDEERSLAEVLCATALGCVAYNTNGSNRACVRAGLHLHFACVCVLYMYAGLRVMDTPCLQEQSDWLILVFVENASDSPFMSNIPRILACLLAPCSG